MTSHTSHQPVSWRPPHLGHSELVQAQEDTLAAPRLRYGILARALFGTLDTLYGKKRTLSKFKVLELVARVPYQTWEPQVSRLRGGSWPAQGVVIV